MTDRADVDEHDPAFGQGLAVDLARLADEAEIPPLPDLDRARDRRPGRSGTARRLAPVAAAVAVVTIGAGYVATRDRDPATVSTVDTDPADVSTSSPSTSVPETSVPATDGSSATTATTPTTTTPTSTPSAPPPTNPSGIPIDESIVVDARLRPRMGLWTIEVVHPDRMPPGTATLAFRIDGQMVDGDAYVPGEVSGHPIDELDGERDETITVSIIARSSGGDAIAESGPVEFDLYGRFQDLVSERVNEPAPRVDPGIVFDARLATRMGVRFLEIPMPDDGPEGTELWEIRIDGAMRSVSSGFGGTAGLNVDHLEPGSTIAVTLVARDADMRPIAESEPVDLSVVD
ncbi:MAG: hypothetical protein S0880_23425 [Actinomycetota bacterium]|nr:hypothetical protein [Actinomycetota bacterium]